MSLFHALSFLFSLVVDFFDFWFSFLWFPKDFLQPLEEASFLLLGGWLLLFGVCDGASLAFFVSLTAWAKHPHQHSLK